MASVDRGSKNGSDNDEQEVEEEGGGELQFPDFVRLMSTPVTRTLNLNLNLIVRLMSTPVRSITAASSFFV